MTTPLPEPLRRCLRSAAEDLRLSEEGWVEVPTQGPTHTRSFGHRDNPSVLLTATSSGGRWAWSAGSGLGAGSQMPWCRIHEQQVELCGNERSALLAALRVAGDDMTEASLCATATLHARLEVIVRHHGLDLFVAPAEPGGGAAPEPLVPCQQAWTVTARGGDGEEFTSEVRANGEHEARMLFLREQPEAEVLLIDPKLARVPSASPETRAALRQWLSHECPTLAALIGA